MKWLRRLALLILLLVLLLASWLFLGNREREPEPSAATRADPAALRDPLLIARGEYLATVGDCASCHTRQGGARYAGGRLLATPFGQLPSSNLTPDRDTGLGGWSFEEFWRALHSGKGRGGMLLYPAFSYTSFTKVSRADALAIFAYLQSLPAVRQSPTPLQLSFPYDVRNSLLVWRALYFKEGEYRNDPARSAQWNRGAYLVQGLAHCNECHVQRDALGGVPNGQPLSGGLIPAQNWYAPDLSLQQNGGLQGWREQDIVDLLKTGQSPKGVALGPMAEVVMQSTQYLHDDDLQAIATYLHALPPRAAPVVADSSIDVAAIVGQGAKIYQQHCADCHGVDGNGIAGVYPPLNGNASVNEPSGINATRAILLGGFAPPTAGQPRPYSMPPFAQQLSDADVAAVVTYIRQAWSNRAPLVQERDVGKGRDPSLD